MKTTQEDKDGELMSRRTRRKGLVLVVVLWTVVLLTLIAASLGRDSRMDMRLSLNRLENVRCKWACRAGVERAIAVLNEDLRASDCLTDYWSDSDEDFNDVALKQSIFYVRVEDEASKLNVNTATKAQLMALPEMTEEIVEAILDWRDGDDTIRAGGAEAGYYLNLPYPYAIRNGPVSTIRELLKVRGMDRELFFGEDTNFNGQLDFNERDGEQSPPIDNEDAELDKGWIAFLTCYSYDKNQDAEGNDRTNINQGSERRLTRRLGIRRSYAKWIVDNRGNGFNSIADLINDKSPKKPPRSSSSDEDRNSDQARAIDLQTFRQIADKITVSEDEQTIGMVNINTAPREVLAAILDGGQDAELLADKIIEHRQTLLSGMESIGELLNVESIKVSTFKKIANLVTTRSDVYTVRCVAYANRAGYRGSTLRSEAVVDRSDRPAKVLYWYQGTSD